MWGSTFLRQILQAAAKNKFNAHISRVFHNS